MFYDIYLYTLCYYMCCLLGACMRCTWLCSLKPGVTIVAHNLDCVQPLLAGFFKVFLKLVVIRQSNKFPLFLFSLQLRHLPLPHCWEHFKSQKVLHQVSSANMI
jgi:hypothetical protein